MSAVGACLDWPAWDVEAKSLAEDKLGFWVFHKGGVGSICQWVGLVV